MLSIQATLRSTIASIVVAASAHAQDAPSPLALVEQVSNGLLQTIQSDRAFQGGDLGRLREIVDQTVMPNVDMSRLTSLAMGRHWRQATTAQQARLENEFKTLLVSTYAGALAQVTARQTIEFRPVRTGSTDAEAVVSTRIRGNGDPIPIDYRLHRVAEGWKIYDVAVAGIWLAENYRNSFAQEIAASGIEGLIETLQTRNKGLARKAGT